MAQTSAAQAQHVRFCTAAGVGHAPGVTRARTGGASPPPDRSIMARLDVLDRTKATLPPDLLRRMEQGMADFERRFEMRQKIEQCMAGFKQRFVKWEERQVQDERERQPAQELERQREEGARPTPTRTFSKARGGPEFSRQQGVGDGKRQEAHRVRLVKIQPA